MSQKQKEGLEIFEAAFPRKRAIELAAVIEGGTDFHDLDLSASADIASRKFAGQPPFGMENGRLTTDNAERAILPELQRCV